jgi:hypothetical protein
MSDNTDNNDNPKNNYIQNKKNRCYECNKKLGLLPIKCRCNNIFCEKHRYAEKHMCSYNYQEQYKKELIKQNNLVISEKISKI